MKQRSLYGFRDWLFNLLIDYFVNSGWVIVIRDFKKSEKRDERTCLGQTNYQEKIIYLDKDCGLHGTRGAPRILIHELCHFGLQAVLEQMSQNLSWSGLKKVKGKYRADKEFGWRELRTIEFEKLFYSSLDKSQIKILQGFIDEARERYRKDKG